MGGFSSLGLCESLNKCCNDLGWEKPLPIQMSSIPPALKGNDVIGTSETGSGKTAAFLLPIMQHWLSSDRPRGFALILAPTRELAIQITEAANMIMNNLVDADGKNNSSLEVFLLIGGVSAADQAVALAWCRHHFIVATPGRLAEHIKQSPGFALHHLSTIKHLVLDEVDRMLSLEFADDLDLLLNLYERPTSSGRQGAKGMTVLERRAKEVAEVDSVNAKGTADISMKRTKYPHPQTYLFTATLNKDGKANILVATDVASRGLDLPFVEKGKQSDNEVGMEMRRRLAEAAWSRAAKAIREEEAPLAVDQVVRRERCLYPCPTINPATKHLRLRTLTTSASLPFPSFLSPWIMRARGAQIQVDRWSGKVHNSSIRQPAGHWEFFVLHLKNAAIEELVGCIHVFADATANVKRKVISAIRCLAPSNQREDHSLSFKFDDCTPKLGADIRPIEGGKEATFVMGCVTPVAFPSSSISCAFLWVYFTVHVSTTRSLVETERDLSAIPEAYLLALQHFGKD
ncbi:hypothetical protein TcWFU_010234 [Taenia crassiceps]|uniref:RNA helicase n=1 Tax=Taenia crassiceps TaxID=6207 RepID=A0ABR4Q486_9CEST